MLVERSDTRRDWSRAQRAKVERELPRRGLSAGATDQVHVRRGSAKGSRPKTAMPTHTAVSHIKTPEPSPPPPLPAATAESMDFENLPTVRMSHALPEPPSLPTQSRPSSAVAARRRLLANSRPQSAGATRYFDFRTHFFTFLPFLNFSKKKFQPISKFLDYSFRLSP
jgi:hypothetical protein